MTSHKYLGNIPMRYLIFADSYNGFPSSCGSMDKTGAGSYLNGHRKGTVKAGWGGPNGPTPSRLIYTNSHRTPDTSLIQRGL